MDCKYLETEADYRAIYCAINQFGKSQGVRFPIMESNLSKKITLAGNPREWLDYPDIKLLGFLGPKKTTMTFDSQEKLDKYKENLIKDLISAPLVSRKQWLAAKILCRMRKFHKFEPLLGTDDLPILTLTKKT